MARPGAGWVGGRCPDDGPDPRVHDDPRSHGWHRAEQTATPMVTGRVGRLGLHSWRESTATRPYGWWSPAGGFLSVVRRMRPRPPNSKAWAHVVQMHVCTLCCSRYALPAERTAAALRAGGTDPTSYMLSIYRTGDLSVIRVTRRISHMNRHHDIIDHHKYVIPSGI